MDLVAQRIDVAVRVGKLKDSSMISRTAGAVEAILVASPKFLQESEKVPAVDGLSLVKTVGFLSGRGSHQWSLVSAKEKRTVKVDPHIALDDFLGVREMVKLGHGVGFIPRYLCEPLIAKGELVHILKSWSSERLPVQVLVPHQKEMHPLVRVFSDFVTKNLSEHFS